MDPVIGRPVPKHKIVSTRAGDEIRIKYIITVKLCQEVEISVTGDFGDKIGNFIGMLLLLLLSRFSHVRLCATP